MTRFHSVVTGIFLLALLFTVGIACAADTDANLSVSKVVTSAAPYDTGQPITWTVTLLNNGPADATNISLLESVLGGSVDMSGVADLGTYDNTTRIWNISKLDNATSAHLTIVTVFGTAGDQTNNVDIVHLDQTSYGTSHASASIHVVSNAPEGEIANLSVSKVVTSAAPYNTGQPITWTVTLLNNGPADATNISLAESMAGFTGLVDMRGVANLGTYDNTTRIWNISKLDDATSAHLTIVTVFDKKGTQINNVDILRLDQESHGNNHAGATVVINNAAAVIPDQPLSVKLTIRPNTLNLWSKGVFTVFVTLYDGESPFLEEGKNKPRVDFASSSLTCNGADMISAGVSNKDGGILIAKFHRRDLENVTSGRGVQINCSGTLVVNGKSVDIEGSDTIRVIGEKKGVDKFISGLMKYLGLEKDDIGVTETGDGNITLSVTLNPDMFKNNGQVKKSVSTKEDASPNKDQNAANKTTGQDQNALKNNGRDKNNNGKNDDIQQSDSDNNGDRGNKNTEKGNDASQGKGNGKKDK